MMQNNILAAISQFGSFMQNPMGMFMQSRFNIPNSVNINNPSEVMQFLLSNGSISQQQINEANQLANQVRNNPMFSNMFR